ncbi:MAG: hypothetical protein AAF458_11100 [Pseudomonadota bacterium]
MSDARGARNLATLVYALQAAAFFTGGLTLLVGVVINYVKRGAVAGTWVDGHFQWQIASFWWSLAGNIVGALTIFLFGLGYLVWLLVAVWLIYRIAKGWLRLVAEEQI